MKQPRKSLDASDRLGVYKRLSDVPVRHRFRHYEPAYEDRDVWMEFCEEYEYAQGNGEDYRQEVNRVGERWLSFMSNRDRHHALASPDDIDAWCADRLENFSLRRTFEHWLRVNRLYDWLQWHTDHPHRYNPALMAAVNGDSATKVWQMHVERTQKRREEREAHQ